MTEEKRVGLVVAGAAARGAYEAGVLSVLIPTMVRQGKPPTVLVGTSAGAINAMLLAQYSHLKADDAVDKLVAIWERLTLSDVIGVNPLNTLGKGARYVAKIVGIPGVKLTHLFETKPLLDTINRNIDRNRLHQNIREGRVHALAMAATAANGRTKIFVEATEGVSLPDNDETRAIDYVEAKIEPDHILASSAIPVLFPPIHVDHPAAEVSGWYRDGLVRLNVPIKPAIDLGANQLALVSSNSDVRSLPDQVEKEIPDIGDAAVQLLYAVLADRMIEDIDTLDKVNQLIQMQPDRCIKMRNGRERQYQWIDYLFVGPSRPGLLGEAADQFFDKHYGNLQGSLGALWSPATSPLWLLGLLLGRNSKSQGELLSWLFFDPEFMKIFIDRGKEDAQCRLEKAQHQDVFPFN